MSDDAHGAFVSGDDGLDLTRLRAIRGARRDHRELLARIEEFCAIHGGGWVAWSGGKDSTAVVDLARQVDPAIPVVFYDCGLDFPDTYAYITELADRWALNLHVIPTEPDLLTLLIAGGDFDPAVPTRRLGVDVRAAMIGAPAARAHARFGAGNLWGVRAAESPGRRQLYRSPAADGGVVSRVDGTASFGPIWDWSTSAVWEYLAGRGVEANPVYAKLAALGVGERWARVDAMIDPARLDNGHIGVLAQGWPAVFERLVAVLPRLADYC